MPTAPIRFLLLIVAGWIGLRVALLLPDWPATEDIPALIPAASAQAPAAFDRNSKQLPDGPALAFAPPADHPLAARRRAEEQASDHTPLLPMALPSSPGARSTEVARPALADHFSSISAAGASHRSVELPGSPALAGAPLLRGGRLSAAAWLLWRGAAGGTLAPGGTLGGGQAGLRLLYRLNGDVARPISLSGRLYAPLDRPQGAEVALGVDVRPLAYLPLNLLAERRQRLGREGRSDFALSVHGGGEARLLRGRARLEGYGQAGIVGIETRDLFVDGAARASIGVGAFEVGVGAWGGAQPGAARLDIGPQAGLQIPVGRLTIRASADWRFRIAGDAAPGSGPALTLSAGF